MGGAGESDPIVPCSICQLWEPRSSSPPRWQKELRPFSSGLGALLVWEAAGQVSCYLAEQPTPARRAGLTAEGRASGARCAGTAGAQDSLREAREPVLLAGLGRSLCLSEPQFSTLL